MSNPPPIETLRVRNIEAAIWKNTGEQGEFYSVTLTRSYKDEHGDWQRSSSFGQEDLLKVAKLADLAHTRIVELTQNARPAKDTTKPQAAARQKAAAAGR
jgi:hypothetical protein